MPQIQGEEATFSCSTIIFFIVTHSFVRYNLVTTTPSYRISMHAPFGRTVSLGCVSSLHLFVLFTTRSPLCFKEPFVVCILQNTMLHLDFCTKRLNSEVDGVLGRVFEAMGATVLQQHKLAVRALPKTARYIRYVILAA